MDFSDTKKNIFYNISQGECPVNGSNIQIPDIPDKITGKQIRKPLEYVPSSV